MFCQFHNEGDEVLWELAADVIVGMSAVETGVPVVGDEELLVGDKDVHNLIGKDEVPANTKAVPKREEHGQTQCSSDSVSLLTQH